MFDNFKSVWYSLREIHSILREEGLKLAKATKTIRQALHYPPQYAAYFAANQVLFNLVVAFYFEVIQAHEGILALKNKGPSRPWRNSRIQRSPPQIRSCHSPISRQISLLCSDALLSMPRSARLAPSSPLSTNGEHVRRNTKPNKRRRARVGRSGCGHQSRPDLGIRQLPSTQAFGASVVPVLSCSKSGPARAGPGSKYTRSVAISPMVI